MFIIHFNIYKVIHTLSHLGPFFITQYCYLLVGRPPMESIGVLMTSPMLSYLEQELERRFKLIKLWNYPSFSAFAQSNSPSIRAVVVDTKIGADAKMIDSLPNLEIVSTFSVGLDKIDLTKCKERGIRVTNTPDVLTDDVADLAIGLALTVLRRICEGDRFVKNGLWKKAGLELGVKVCPFPSFCVKLL